MARGHDPDDVSLSPTMQRRTDSPPGSGGDSMSTWGTRTGRFGSSFSDCAPTMNAMTYRPRHAWPIADRPRGAAAVELALLLPFLCFIFFVVADYSRLIADVLAVVDCARNGALFAADPNLASNTPYVSIEQAALASADGLSPAPSVITTYGTDANNHDYVEVTVSHTFKTMIDYPGIPHEVAIRRTIRMRVLSL